MEQLSFNQQSLAFQPGGRTPSPLAAPGRRAVIRTRRREHPMAEESGNVTEIILPRGQVENFQLLLPMLTQLNQEKRWLAWIDPPQALVSKWQKMHGIVASELLVLRSTAELPAQQLAERALRAGTCHAVVMWTEKLARSALASLQKASAEGNSHGVVLRQR
ncbi:SulA-like leucine-rich domain-containing protein [Marinobacter lutaoensis]|jgi:cell division inhibitor SulA|uniref:LexA family transcriptional regulator n=1 Tax=Marinobacter lutaoensis TaxID=135739 RepID=A0A1V2DXH5_9GAMM|nr:SulA-like leucine-rich domain-containing protein [Marinobacter lutaoensis]MBE02851.1 LexA family transcriptional regulator [Marinobacter sp.]MBI43215.1 LexA family transcriptional regulator [Oceanospirillales bacterium]NVD34480.1 LexA family transcriptional regulator [Marinobacter lutaoensis]ONF45120.1 LexA family transcriptional regulator [Marinobacter lutaoensis]|tara:strand:+ start:508 stop:993 length:486 start_codon:yes stop_codon:yes gene_type:complete